MAKMTISDLKTFIGTMILANKQLVASLTATSSSIDAMVDKVGKMINISNTFNDKYPELEGSTMAFGKIVEEYFVNLTLPVLTTASDGTISPQYPSFENAVYSLPLPKYKLKTSIPYNDIEASVNNASQFASVVTKIMKAFADSYKLTRKYAKLQLLGNVIKAVDSKSSGIKANLISTIAQPTDTLTGEAFLKQVKTNIETAERENEVASLSQCLIGETPKGSLYLYVKEGILPSLDVDTLAGAFNIDKLALKDVTIKTVPDFGSAGDSGKTYAMLVDVRGIKLHNTAQFTLSQLSAEDAFMNYVKHAQDTAFISNYTYIHLYRNA